MGYKNIELTYKLERPLTDIYIEYMNHFIDNLVSIYIEEPTFEVTNSLFYKFMWKK